LHRIYHLPRLHRRRCALCAVHADSGPAGCRRYERIAGFRLPCLQSAGARWYANLPLAEDGLTTAAATFQNGALEVPFTVDWVPYNLMDHDGETLIVCKGDSVKLEALGYIQSITLGGCYIARKMGCNAVARVYRNPIDFSNMSRWAR
jgi:hypothetical protein